jgi:hypothetical protein
MEQVVLSVYFIPTEFKWDDVKVDKYRENYLGHSVKAPVGRWQKGKYYHVFHLPFVPLFTCCTY